jgi:hypothetical protein
MDVALLTITDAPARSRKTTIGSRRVSDNRARRSLLERFRNVTV